jgi:hypothetical protein
MLRPVPLQDVSAANTVCWNSDIFNKNRILLMHIN